MNQLDFKGLSESLLSQAVDLLNDWLPGGKLQGREYMCGGITGGPGDSFRFNTKTGAWADFADDSLKGGDLISLYAAIKGIKNGEAAKQLSEKIGYDLKRNQMTAIKPSEPAPTPPPTGTPPPTMVHSIHGIPSSSWCYRDASGEPLFYVARYDTDAGKQLCPWSWVDGRWTPKGFPSPRPLYGLDVLRTMPNAPVLVVEGEKAADAARAMVGSKYAVITWPNGSQAVSKADWSPIKDRSVLIWPDADAPGIRAAKEIARIPGLKSAKIINTDGQPEKWDAADALNEGWDWKRFLGWVRPRLESITVNINVTQDEPEVRVNQSLQAIWDELGLAMAGNGHPACNIDNAMRILDTYEPFKNIVWWDEFYKRIFTKWNSKERREWCDVDTIALTRIMQGDIGMSRLSDDVVFKAISLHATENSRNEPRDWMDSLVWDGTERISNFFTDCLGAAQSEYTTAASTNFWIGIVARIYRPGCQLDNMVVLEGAQGIGKTQALKRIGGDWYTNASESVQNKDFFQALHGKLVVEIAELDSFSKADVTKIKQTITNATDRYRASYGRLAENHARMCIFVGSTNEKAYLRDVTGNRRFWPIACGAIDLEKIEGHRDQLYAEAVARFKSGEPWYQMPAESTKQEQENRRQEDEWENNIAEFLNGKQTTTLTEIAVYLGLGTEKLSINEQRRIINGLRFCKWEKRSFPDGNRVRKIWMPISSPPEVPVQAELMTDQY